MKVVNTLDRLVWKKFVDENPLGNVFHTPEMFDVYAHASGYHPFLWAVIDDSGQVLALFIPVQITLGVDLLRFFTRRNVAFGSVLTVDGERGRQALALLLKTYNKKIFGWPLFTELRNVADLSEVQDVLQDAGYVYEEHSNYLIDLQRDLYDVLQGLGHDARHRIRQNLRRGLVQVESISDRAQIPTVYQLLQKTYHWAHIPLAQNSLFDAAFEILGSQNMVRFTIGYIDGAPVSTMVCLLYKNIVYGWYNGSDRAYGSHSPNELMYWDTIQWGVLNGYHVFDLGGAGKLSQHYGVRDFKAKFNGKMVTYGRNVRVHSRKRLKLSESIYQLTRKALALTNRKPDKKK